MEGGNDVKAALSIYMQTLDMSGFTTTLKTTIVPLTSLSDSSNFNIFHDLAECLVKESYLLEYLEILTTEFHDRYFDEAKEMIKSLLNSSAGQDKQTPLMCAVRHNRCRLLKEFIALEADFWRKDVNGKNIVHIAAACGFECILVYLCFHLRMSYVEPDAFGRTPLHLACLEGQVGTGMLLIIWNEELDKLDKEGFSPLQLSVLSQCYKLVRNLLIMGANPHLRDSMNNTTLELAHKRGDNSIISLLVTPNQQPSTCCSTLNPFSRRIGPVKPNPTRPVVFLLLSLFRIAIISTSILPNMNKLCAIPSLLLFLLTLLFFFISCCKDPGFTKNPKNYSLLDLYEAYRPEYVCPYCEKRKPKHARHCHYCKKCVKVITNQEFDHHCPWINNCVGRDNYKPFIAFLTFGIFDYAFQASLAILNYLGILVGKDEVFYEIKREMIVTALGIAGISLGFLLFFMPVWLTQIMNWTKPKKKKKEGETLVRQRSTSCCENSDTASMMLGPSNEWNPESFNQASFLVKKDRESQVETGCCLSG